MPPRVPVIIPLSSEHARTVICMLQCFLGFFETRKRVHPERIFAGFERGRGYDPALVAANDGEDNEGQRAGVITVNVRLWQHSSRIGVILFLIRSNTSVFMRFEICRLSIKIMRRFDGLIHW
jgi:hypothetical protein